MKILIIEHAVHENPGAILDWISENNFESKTLKPFCGDILDRDLNFDLLIIMGGPQSARETEKYPFLQDEIKFTKIAIENNKYVLGICLGAQIISESFGAITQKSTHKEYGFYPVEFNEEALKLKAFSNFPDKINCLHWHNDMPGLNSNLTKLAESEGCPVQAICHTQKVVGLQFHMEIRKKDIQGLIDYDKDTLKINDDFIMNPEEIISNDFDSMNLYMKKFLDNFIG